MTPDHLGGLSIITWSLSVLIIEGGKPERQRKHGEGSGGGQAGGRGPGAAEASGSYKGREVSLPWSFLETHLGLVTSRTVR